MADVADVAKPRRSLWWPGLVLLLLGGQVALMLAMVLLATRDETLSVEPDYYRKGLEWDQTAAQMRENTRLGWSARLDVAKESNAAGEREVRLTLRDADGRPLTGAQVELVAFAHARGHQRQTVSLSPDQDGTYTVVLRFSRPGVWEFRFAVRCGNHVFTQTLVRDIRSPEQFRQKGQEPWKS
jgi:nitrogen fixation protein FixH